MYYTVRLCTAQYDFGLHSAIFFVLHSTTLYFTVRLCITQCDFVLHSTTLYYTVRFCTAQYDFALHTFFVLHNAILDYTTRFCTTGPLLSREGNLARAAHSRGKSSTSPMRKRCGPIRNCFGHGPRLIQPKPARWARHRPCGRASCGDSSRNFWCPACGSCHHAAWLTQARGEAKKEGRCNPKMQLTVCPDVSGLKKISIILNQIIP